MCLLIITTFLFVLPFAISGQPLSQSPSHQERGANRGNEETRHGRGY